jgi:DNA repair protein RecO (recombination protein O)
VPTRNDRAIVLRLSDYSETSQIVTMFTAESGLVRLSAKGSRRGTKKKFSAGLDLLEYGDVGYVPPRGDAGLGTLTEWTQRDLFSGLRRDLARQYGGLYAAEVVSRLTEEFDPHVNLFDDLLRLLRILSDGESSIPETATRDVATPIVRFQAALLRAIGYAPIMRHCVDCGRKRVRGTAAYFSSTAGGYLCRDCEPRHSEKRRISPTLLDRPRENQKPREWLPLLDYHLAVIAGGPLKTSPTLLKLLTA